MNLSAKAEGRQVYITHEHYGRVTPAYTLTVSEANHLRAALNEAISEASMSLLEHKKSALAALQREVDLMERAQKQ